MTSLSYPKYIYIYINVHTLLICLLLIEKKLSTLRLAAVDWGQKRQSAKRRHKISKNKSKQTEYFAQTASSIFWLPSAMKFSR